MDRVRATIKEMYQQVDEYEFNRINPYKQMLESIRAEFPNATITSCKTQVEVFGALQVPTLTMHYVTGIPA